jgi:hypothetical protein
VGRIDNLARSYERHVSVPWPSHLAGPERIWFAVYDKTDERRLRQLVDEFEMATKKTRHGWELVDLTNAFAEWMATQKYRETYFQSPEDLNDTVLVGFRDFVAKKIKDALGGRDPEQKVTALLGVGCLFGFLKVSEVLQVVQSDIQGRMLVFFPGEYENNNYRLLDARVDWNYLAVPITAQEGEPA